MIRELIVLASSEGGGFNPLAFDPAAFVLALITFLIALAILTKACWKPLLKAVQDQVSEAEMLESVKNLAAEISQKLDEGKSMALGILLTEQGLAVKEVAVSEDSMEVFGMAVTNDAVVAGAAVATEEGVAYEVAVETEEGAAVEAGVVTEDGAVIVDAVEPADAPEDEDETSSDAV